jgi:AcrR family transcriptional regulator
MATPPTATETFGQRPKRADAQRNYVKLVTAAREAFAEDGTSASLEDIARRAGVGIGTLYRHFPSRQELLEATYLEEVDAMARSAADVAELPPWDALAAWLRRFVGYMAVKHALAEELFAYIDRDAEFFKGCRDALYGAGEPLLRRAQEAGEVRPDTDISDVVRMVGSIARMPAAEPDQIERVLDVALDGLRYRAPAS